MDRRNHRPPRRQPPRNRPSQGIPINIRTASTRRKGMPVSITLIATLLFIFVLAYLVWAIHQALTPDIPTEAVLMSNMDEQRSISGMIVRTEDVVYAPIDGRFEATILETERVRQGTLVGSVRDVDAVTRIENDIANIEEDIRRLGSLRHFSESDATVQRINTNIHNAMNNTMHNFSATNMSDINNLYSRLVQLTYNRNQIVRNYDAGAVGDVGRQLIQLQAAQDQNRIHMYAGGTGIMFQIIDGQEHWNPGNMRTMSRYDVNQPVDYTLLFPIRDVEAGEPIFKIVGLAWYIVTFMPHEMAASFVEGTDRQIWVQNVQTGIYEPMTMRIVHAERRTAETKVIFRSTRNVIDFLGQRNVSIRTTDQISRGLKVSNSAITERRYIGIPITHVQANGSYFVHHLTEDGLRTVAIDVADRTEYMVYVREETLPLILGDVLAPISLQGNNYTITESTVRLVHGVYLATRGYANFVTINLSGELSRGDGYILLDPAINPNLRQFDTIVTDATQVTDRQILRSGR